MWLRPGWSGEPVRPLTEAEAAELLKDVGALIWRHAAVLTGVDPNRPADEVLNSDEAKPASLATVAVAESAAVAVGSIIRSAAYWAADHGADYGELGAAAGITRQGARHRWLGLAEVTVAARARIAKQGKGRA
jgi:hypothetical protein